MLGQPDFVTNAPNRGASVSATTLYNPTGIAFDSQDNLYVADYNNARVLRFSAPIAGTDTASVTARLQ